MMDLVLHSEIVMLAGEDVTSWIVYNRLATVFGPFPALVEKHLPRRVLIRNRMRKLGIARTLSQVAFVFLIRPWLKRGSQARIADICRAHGLEASAPAAHYIRHIDSVNSAACKEALKIIAPKVVVVNGTRIIKGDVLKATPAVFLNIHQGITPQYRGSHGSYWALYNDDVENCGVTVHVVDEGIDTGGVVARAHADPTPGDNFVTYPYLQTAAALPGLVAAITAALAGKLEVKPIEGPSAVWYHPGFFQYIIGRFRGVR
jgi:folate-dependent phosphoribosylglycinamide formyltransferase PurN